MRFMVLGAAGRMGRLHAGHLIGLGHTVEQIDPKIDDRVMHMWPAFDGDGIVVATPAEQHAADLNTILSAERVKHIFVEKPICLIKQLPGMRKMVLDAKIAGVSIHVGYNLRFNRGVRELMEKKYRHMSRAFLLRQVPKRPIAHFLEEWASHEIDLALHMGGQGEIRGVVMHWDQGRPEMICAIRHHDNVISIVRVDGYYERNVRIINVLDERGDVWFRDIEGTVSNNDYLAEITAWIQEIENRGATGLATAADGIAAIDVFVRGNKA